MMVYLVIYSYYEEREVRGVFSSFELAVKNAQSYGIPLRYHIEEHTLDGNEPAKDYYPTVVKVLTSETDCIPYWETTYVYNR